MTYQALGDPWQPSLDTSEDKMSLWVSFVFWKFVCGFQPSCGLLGSFQPPVVHFLFIHTVTRRFIGRVALIFKIYFTFRVDVYLSF